MKKFLFLLTAAVAAMSLCAAPVDQAGATKVAKKYLAETMYAGKIMAPAALNPVLLKAEPASSKLDQPVYYIFNTSTTYLVVAGDDRAEQILMVGDQPLKLDRIPDGLQYLLDCYKEQLTFLMERPNLQVERPSERPMLRAVTYGPLLTAKWDQEAPYNNLCKFTYNNRTYTCLTGCPATSASMVLYYWKYPTTQVPQVSGYTSTLDIGSYYSNEVSYTYPAVSATTFDWGSMRDTYSSGASGTSATAVATLMRYVGQLEQMMYGVTGSGIYTTESQKIANMFKTLGYDSNTRLVYKTSFSENNWATLIQNEMAAGRPVVYLGVDSNEGGHAFNVDGYRDSDNKYHVNFGWSGDGNNWYAMNAFTYTNMTFNNTQRAIVGIQPPGGQITIPQLTVNPTSLTFAGEVGETYTQTFTISGVNLYGDVTITKSGNSVYSVSPTTLTAAQAKAGAQITVTYSPTLVGTQTGTITVSSSGAESQTVTLSGTSSKTPTLTVEPASLSMSTTVGTAVSKTFVVTGANLTDNVLLDLGGEYYDLFTIDKMSILKSAAANGVTVTVTYDPDEVGTHGAYISITSTGAETKTVALTGTATEPERTITLTPTSLSFETVAGQSVTQTFNLKGTNLSSSVTLALSGSGSGNFSLSNTSVTASRANRGLNITVTYNPTAAGTHTATVTVSGGGADNVTVNLNGTATLVKFTPVMLAAVEDYINLTEFRADWTDATPEANVVSYTLEVNPKPAPELLHSLRGNADDYRLITGITDKFYTVENLTAEGTFLYKVKAIYVDGTESDWSNTEEVTLFQKGHGYVLGDVDHSGSVSISDVTTLIDYVLDNTTPICLFCADVDGDGKVGISDVTLLIDMILGGE